MDTIPYTGTVTEFHYTKNWGRISFEQGSAFFHGGEWKFGLAPVEGEEVRFDLVLPIQYDERGKENPIATNVRPLVKNEERVEPYKFPPWPPERYTRKDVEEI